MGKEKLLFIDCCVRGEGVSRTYGLCKEFFDSLGDKYEIEVVNPAEENILYMDKYSLEIRDGYLAENDREGGFFDYSKQFAAADRIVIGAPYWDWSFPACLKNYIEKISVDGITFTYEDNQCKGLCNAKKALYICTAGGVDEVHLGSMYIKELFKRYGINDFDEVTAWGIDIYGNDVKAIMNEAKEKLKNIAKDF